jgi:hypothetical protein
MLGLTPEMPIRLRGLLIILASGAAEAVLLFVLFGPWSGSRIPAKAGMALLFPVIFVFVGLFELVSGQSGARVFEWFDRTFPDEAQKRRIGCLLVFLLGALGFVALAFVVRHL